MRQEAAETLGGATAKATPVLAVAGASFAGYSLQDWVYITAILYSLLLSVKLLHDWTKPYWVRWKESKKSAPRRRKADK